MPRRINRRRAPSPTLELRSRLAAPHQAGAHLTRKVRTRWMRTNPIVRNTYMKSRQLGAVNLAHCSRAPAIWDIGNCSCACCERFAVVSAVVSLSLGGNGTCARNAAVGPERNAPCAPSYSPHLPRARTFSACHSDGLRSSVRRLFLLVYIGSAAHRSRRVCLPSARSGAKRVPACILCLH
jgi:hypothetical protein